MKTTLTCTLSAMAIGIAFVTSGCGGGGGKASGPVVGDPAHGKALYTSATLGKRSAAGCGSCHKYDASAGDEKKAPFTHGTGTRAATRVPGMTAEEYIKESILHPDAFVVDNYKKGDMYQKWSEDLSDQEIADLVAYVASEK